MNYTSNKALHLRALNILELINGCEEREERNRQHATDKKCVFWTPNKMEYYLNIADNYNRGGLRLRMAYRKTLARITNNLV